MSDIDCFKGGRNAPSSVVILLDESGDLGSSSRSTKHFVVAAMMTRDPNELVRLLKNVRMNLGKRRWDGGSKFKKSSDSTRILMLEGIAKLDCQIARVSFENDGLPSALSRNKYMLYMTACEFVLPELFRRASAPRIHVVMDKYYSKKWERDKLEEQVRFLLAKYHAGNFISQAQVSKFDSASKKELQVLHDFVVGAIFHSIERDVNRYMKVIESKVVFGLKR